MSTSYEWDVECADLEFERLQKGFTIRDREVFGTTAGLAALFAQFRVHPETGSLAESIKFKETASSPRRWEGDISAGGASSPKNPVRYALSEYFGKSPKYGGPPSHNYFLDAEASLPGDILGVAESFLSREARHPHGPLGTNVSGTSRGPFSGRPF